MVKRPSVIQDLTGLIKWAVVAAVVGGAGYLMFREPSPTLVQLERQQAQSGLWFYVQWVSIGLMLVALASGVAWLVFVVVANIRNRMLASKIVNGKLIDNYNTTVNGHRHKITTIVDIDKLINPTVRMDRNGTVGIDEFGAADVGLQASHSARVTADRTRKAIKAQQAQVATLSKPRKAPTKAMLQDQNGVFAEQAETERLKQQLYRNRLESKVKTTVAPSAPIEWQTVPIREAFNHSSENNLCVAQDQKRGDLFFWNQSVNGAHVRIHGESGSGKTQLALGFVAQMIVNGWDVVILDRRKFKNYKCIEGLVQFVDTRPAEMLLTALQQVSDIHEERDIALGAEGAEDIGELKKPPARICIVIDEFLAQMRAAKHADLDKEILMLLESLTAETRATGIHFLFIDQKPVGSVWGDVMRANVGAAFMGYMPKGQARTTTGSDMGDQLENHVFYFERSSQFVKGWYCKPLIEARASQLPAMQRAVIDVAHTTRELEHKAKTEQKKLVVDADDALTPKQKTAINFVLGNPEMSVRKSAAAAAVSAPIIQFAKDYIRANNIDTYV